ncbi:MAG: thioredoxin-disulfide reductase [Candidatus Fischerbacteria bacterium RBG_13_37_8]|uniref:Thioredoxin reductase n=1 Tax=Candidatus Fischerbacteria bacterium RBG_13_37_8 TaxID=1817863 RepID=A0A1F5VMB3_9BACT|nr:MAG: thioredoxin-disulfide reductase [Candidatus Fischerbacteria bacterium RBG_13_37_8]
MNTYNVIIIGSGPAGYTAGLYTARANLEPLIICGYQAGGQLTLTSEVENFPGFPEGILGPQLMENMKKQATKFGAQLIFKEVTAVNFKERPFKVIVDDGEYQAKSVIIATGSYARMLGVENEKKFYGRGLSTCATCDAAFFKDRKVAVVGGGDSAMEEALFISRFASEVQVIHRRDALRASKVLQDRAFKNDKIKFIWNTVVRQILGERFVTGIELENIIDRSISTLEINGVFVAIGHEPKTKIFQGEIALDAHGYIVADQSGKTDVEGIFAAGDVKDFRYRQAITAAGSGCIAALEVAVYLSEN